MDPFNIDILVLSNSMVKYMRPVTTLNIHVASSAEFDPNGLFSTEIFGEVGSPDRATTPGYIDLQAKILHPLIYEHFLKLKGLYGKIMAGKAYAIFDPKLKDFVPASPEDGETGYHFFISHMEELKLDSRNSDARDLRIKMVKMFGNKEHMLNKFIVLPAGLRDYTIDDNGKPSEDEVNSLYRKLLNISTLLSTTNLSYNDPKALDTSIFKLQNTALEIYKYFLGLTDGKKKFIQGKWAKRAVARGTRNVITSIPIVVDDVDSNNHISYNDTVIGLYQYLAANSPVVKHGLITKYLSKIFNHDNNTAMLVNPETMETEYIDIATDLMDKWMSDEGLDTVISSLEQEVYRSQPIMVSGRYLMLVNDTGKSIEPILNTGTMSENINKKTLRPITYAELMYLAIYQVRDKYPAFLTRYPVAGVGGIYPTKLYLKTTIKGRTVDHIENGIVVGEIPEYPILTESYYNSLSPHPSHLVKLVGDYDGDTVSLNILNSDDAIKEIEDLLNSPKFYVSPSGDLLYSAESDTVNLVLKHMTVFN